MYKLESLKSLEVSQETQKIFGMNALEVVRSVPLFILEKMINDEANHRFLSVEQVHSTDKVKDGDNAFDMVSIRKEILWLIPIFKVMYHTSDTHPTLVEVPSLHSGQSA